MALNTENFQSACLKLLIEEPSEIQASLPTEYRNEVILYKLLNSVRDVRACQLGFQRPGRSIHGVISDLQASFTTALLPKQNEDPSANFLNRRYIRKKNERDMSSD